MPQAFFMRASVRSRQGWGTRANIIFFALIDIMSKKILVTGASGFIGSHTCVELLAAGFDVVAVDNLCNSAREAMARVERISGKSVPFYEADVRDRAAMAAILREHAIDAVIHFAGLKAVGE